MKMKVGLIGKGLIGSEVERRVLSKGWDIAVVVRSDGVYRDGKKIDSLKNYKKYLSDLHIGFLSIPTYDDGRTALGYMMALLETGTPAITSEKGSLSNYFHKVKPYLKLIGLRATVGGGIGITDEVEQRSPEEFHVVCNGTLNYVFDEVSKSKSLESAIQEAKDMGYAEPGAKNALEVINKESTSDIPMKAAILFNVGLRHLTSKSIRAKDIRAKKIGEMELKKLVKEAEFRRYIVSFTRRNTKEKVLGGFNYEAHGWHISAGFKDVRENELYSGLVREGVTNALVIPDGTCIFGPGAGARPTVSSMMKDAEALLERKF